MTDMVNLAPPVELTGAELEAAAKRAHELEVSILKRAGDVNRTSWELARDLYEFQEAGAWALCGHDTLEEFLAQPGLGMSRPQFFRLTRVYRDLVTVKQLDAAAIADIDPSTMDEVRTALMRGESPDEEIITDARVLGRSDLRKKYGPAKRPEKTPDPIRDEAGGEATDFNPSEPETPETPAGWDEALEPVAEGTGEPTEAADAPVEAEVPSDAGPVSEAVSGEVVDEEDATLTLTVADLDKFQVREGDTLVLTVKAGTTEEHMTEFMAAIKAKYPGTDVVCMEEGESLKRADVVGLLESTEDADDLATESTVVAVPGDLSEPDDDTPDLVARGLISSTERVRLTHERYLEALKAFVDEVPLRPRDGRASIVAIREDAEANAKDFNDYVDRYGQEGE